MIRHTPGEWRVTRGAQGDPFSIEGPKGTVAHIKTIVTRSRDRASYVVAHEETEANARLIAEAPAMREKLHESAESLTDILRHYQEVSLSESARNNLILIRDDIRALLARVDGTGGVA